MFGQTTSLGIPSKKKLTILKEWVTGRLTWMDNNMFGSCEDLETSELIQPKDISLFPNPASSSITIKSSNIIPNAIIQIVTTDGRTSSKVSVNQLNTITMDISELEAGIYFVRVLSNNESYTTFKLIKK